MAETQTTQQSGSILNPTSLIAGGLETGLGLLQYFNAKKALKQLNKTPVPRYGLTPQVEASIREAGAMRNQGFSSAERNSFMNDVTQGSNVAYNRAFNQSPSLSNAINAALSINNNSAYLKYAAMDAQRRMENRMYSDRLNNNYQTISDRNTAVDIDRRNKAETNWGQSMQAGLNNIITGAALGTGAGLKGFKRGKDGALTPMGYGYNTGAGDMVEMDTSNLG